MLFDTNCELCGGNDWQVLGQRTYTRAEAEHYPPHVQKRFKVLFHKWFPERESITLTSALCQRCGFIIYLPRPQVADIDAKYIYLEELGQDYGQTPSDSAIETHRSNNVFQFLNRAIDLQRVHRVLDYGGGDGRLMQSFHDAGKECFLVDYNQNCIPEVTKISDKIEDVNGGETFDLIVCSHVIEHVAQPLHVVKQLISHLRPDGHIFVEAPLEVWRRPPLQREPVTHINFFTPNSLYNLLLLAGLTVQMCTASACPHPSGIENHGIRAIGQKSEPLDSSIGADLRSPDAMELLDPTMMDILHHHLRIPWRMPKLALRRLKRVT